jgi:hypothetical protein
MGRREYCTSTLAEIQLTRAAGVDISMNLKQQSCKASTMRALGWPLVSYTVKLIWVSLWRFLHMDEFNQERVWAARVVRVGDVYCILTTGGGAAM